MERLRVELQTGSADEPLPARFGWSGTMREVREVLDRWPGRDVEYFRVRCDDGALYILRHDEAEGSWELHFYDRDR